MKPVFFLFLVVCISVFSFASTYVGNGGNAGDVEARVAISQIQQTLKAISANSTDRGYPLCHCSELFKRHPLCDSLNQLTKEQTTYCGDVLSAQLPQLLSILENPNSFQIIWTHEPIEVMEGQQKVAVDAVTQTGLRQITLNKKRFLEMQPYEREFLLTHELLHLTKNQNEGFSDERPHGPFAENGGTRHLLNSMAAATALRSFDYEIVGQYRGALLRSQYIKNFWISYSGANLSSGKSSGRFKDLEDYRGAQLNVRYHWSDWGAFFQGSQYTGRRGFLTSVQAEEKIQAFSLGIAYRWAPFENPLSFWGQSYFLPRVGVEKLKGNYYLSDNFVDVRDEADSTSLIADVSYYLPLQWDFWVFLGLGVSHHRYDYKNVGTSYDGAQTFNYLGVSYGF